MKRSLLAAVATSVILTVVATSRSARADEDSDPWFGKDKALHFAASSAIAAGGYAVGAVLFDARGHALIFGGAAAAAAGIGKEVLDATGSGDPSWRDLAWDGIGTVTGLAVAWGIDLLVRGVSKRHPAFEAPAVTPAVTPDGASLAVRVSF